MTSKLGFLDVLNTITTMKIVMNAREVLHIDFSKKMSFDVSDTRKEYSVGLIPVYVHSTCSCVKRIIISSVMNRIHYYLTKK